MHQQGKDTHGAVCMCESASSELIAEAAVAAFVTSIHRNCRDCCCDSSLLQIRLKLWQIACTQTRDIRLASIILNLPIAFLPILNGLYAKSVYASGSFNMCPVQLHTCAKWILKCSVCCDFVHDQS